MGTQLSSTGILTAMTILRNSVATVDQFNSLLPVVIAQYAAMKAPLPAAPVSDIYSYIIENKIDLGMYDIVSQASSQCSIVYNEVRHMALQFYRFRYAMLHGGMESLAFAVAAFTGATGDLVSQEVKSVLHTVRDDAKISDAIKKAIFAMEKA